MKLWPYLQKNLLFVSMISFVFIVSSALALSTISSGKLISSIDNLSKSKSFAPIPTITDNIDTYPVVSARAALAVDLDSGIILYEKEADTPFLPASTTKIITALVAMDYYPETATLRVGRLAVEGQKMGLVYNEEISIRALLDGLLMYSANDAAEVLAINFPGGREKFIDTMNLKAGELGLENSNFVNPAGLDGYGQVTTARDLIRAASVAMQNPLFAQIVGTKQKVVTSTDGKILHRLTNINELVDEVDGVLGVKTGWTQDARENLVTYIDRDGHVVGIAVLGSQDRFGETKELIDWIYGSYEWSEVKPPFYSP